MYFNLQSKVLKSSPMTSAPLSSPLAPEPPVANGKKSPISQKLSIQRKSVFQVLRQQAADNGRFFDGGGWFNWSYTTRFCQCCKDIESLSCDVEALVDRLQMVAPTFDYDSNTPGNGFRSLICVVDTCVLHLIRLFGQISEQRASLVFRAAHYCKELETYKDIMKFFNDALTNIAIHVQAMEFSELFPMDDELDEDDKYTKLMRKIEQLDTCCFYGRALGFQFASSAWRVFQVIGVVLATYSVNWEQGKSLGALITSGKLLLSPEQRAKRIIKVTREADIEFCKGFWNLAEGGPYHQLPNWFCPQMAVTEVLQVESSTPLYLDKNDGQRVLIPKPSAHCITRPVPTRLICNHLRGGMAQRFGERKEASPYLVLHCHGGGFVATSSKSAEPYLRHWAKHMDCPIISIDYSLSPEYPYPRPIEEVLYVYAWVLNNPQLVGWTGEKVVFTGDSAGGNLVTAVCLRMIDLNIKRLPDGLVPIYAPFIFQYLPSPSRLLSLMDPLLHMGIILRCAAAYIGGLAELDPHAMPKDNNHKHEKKLDPHRTLGDYVAEVSASKAQPLIDFGAGSTDVFNLINLQPGSAPPPDPVMFDLGSAEDYEEPQAVSTDDATNETADANVEIQRDPSRIWVTTSLMDHQLIDYLRSHPLTKESMTMYDSSHTPLTKTDGVDLMEMENKRKLERSQSVCENKPLRKRSLSQTFGDAVALATGHAFDNVTAWLEPTPTPQERRRKDSLRMSGVSFSPGSESYLADTFPDDEPEEDELDGILSKLQKMPVPKNPEISPMFASPEQLKKLPPCWFVACHMDPLLDDTIAFARKLRASGGTVLSIDLVDSLPHGFLNFTFFSPECRDASILCMKVLKRVLASAK